MTDISFLALQFNKNQCSKRNIARLEEVRLLKWGIGEKEVQWSEACSRWKILSKIKEGNRITFRCSWRDKSDIMADRKPETYPKIFGLSGAPSCPYTCNFAYLQDRISSSMKQSWWANSNQDRNNLDSILNGEWILIHWFNPFTARIW